jgi:hypothetical protein
MNDDFEATFVVDVDIDAVWEAVARHADPAADGVRQYLITGFPAFGHGHGPGALGTELEAVPGKLLRLRKVEMPCAGTEIAVTLEALEGGTRVTVVQSGFDSWFQRHRGIRDSHGHQIVRDLRLFIERGVVAPGTNWGTPIGIDHEETGTGCEVLQVSDDSLAARAGITNGDLLLTLAGVRIHDSAQLWTVQALIREGEEYEVSWVRDRELMGARVVL